jgi:hypothetical protein
MSQYTPFLSSLFIRQMDSSAAYYFKEISTQYDHATGIKYSEAVIDEVRRTIHSICSNPDLYSSYRFKSSNPPLNDKLNQLDWKSTTTKRFHNRLFFIIDKNRIYFSTLYGAGQDTDHIIIEDVNFKELGLDKSVSMKNKGLE